jgi:hypothetical protein
VCAFSAGFSQVSVFLFAGPQTVRARYKIDGQLQTSDFKAGLQAGVSAKIPFDTKLYFAPSIYYSLKGYRVSFSRPSNPPDPTAVSNNTVVHTLEFAPLLQVDFSDRPRHFFLRFGPSLDFQLYGQEKYKLANGSTISQKMPYGFTHYGRYAASGILHAGIESKRTVLYLQYTQGLTNLDNTEGGPSILYRAVGITIGKLISHHK